MINKNRTEYCGAQSRHYALCLFFHDFLPHQSTRARRSSRNSLHREMNEFPFVCISRVRFHIPTRPRSFRLVRWILIFNLELSGPTIFIPISFLLSNHRNIGTFVPRYDTIGREENLFIIMYTHWRSENSYNKIFKIKDESYVYIPIFKIYLQFFQKKFDWFFKKIFDL